MYAYIEVPARNMNRQISSEFVYITLSNQQKIFVIHLYSMIYHLNKDNVQ